ncbi:MAG: helix-turn-helix transcriptional regulator [Syntrophorhabdales bacterium]
MPLNLCRIGQLLRETREKKGITFNEVSKALFIKTRTIEAIEAGGWDSLPALVYVKGYVRQYAAFLNILDLLERELSSKEDETTLQGPEGVKKGILRGWKFRKKRAIGEKQASSSSGEFRLPIAVSPSYRPVETDSSDQGEESVVHDTNTSGDEDLGKIGIDEQEKKEFVLR